HLATQEPYPFEKDNSVRKVWGGQREYDNNKSFLHTSVGVKYQRKDGDWVGGKDMGIYGEQESASERERERESAEKDQEDSEGGQGVRKKRDILFASEIQCDSVRLIDSFVHSLTHS